MSGSTEAENVCVWFRRPGDQTNRGVANARSAEALKGGWRGVWCVVWLYVCVCVCDVVWCGVVWCGVVWCGVVWCGVVWCGVVWCGVVWCGVVWCGVVWCGVVWCGVCVCVCVFLGEVVFLGAGGGLGLGGVGQEAHVPELLPQGRPDCRLFRDTKIILCKCNHANDPCWYLGVHLKGT